jgi:hypothetical protein
MTREPENATAVAAASAREPPIDDDEEDMAPCLTPPLLASSVGGEGPLLLSLGGRAARSPALGSGRFPSSPRWRLTPPSPRWSACFLGGDGAVWWWCEGSPCRQLREGNKGAAAHAGWEGVARGLSPNSKLQGDYGYSNLLFRADGPSIRGRLRRRAGAGRQLAAGCLAGPSLVRTTRMVSMAAYAGRLLAVSG